MSNEVRLITMDEVLDRVCMSKTQLYRLINSGEFPKPVPVGDHRIGFIEAEVKAWIEQRIKMRDEGIGAEKRRARAIRAVGGHS
jgi:prophage regulatory protein